MKRSFWITGVAVLAVLLAGGGGAWWLIAAERNQPARPLKGTADLVYTGGDLAGFLIDQDAARAVTGTDIRLGAVGSSFQAMTYSREPSVCMDVTGPLTLSPAGYRDVDGGLFEGEGASGRALHLSQAAYQYPTILDASDAFAEIKDAWEGCEHFTETFGFASISLTPSDAQLTSVDPGRDRDDLVGAIVDYTGGQEKSIAVVAMRTNNVITLAQVLSSGPASNSSLGDETVRKLAAAVADRADAAASATSQDRQVTRSEPSPWIIGFGSIGPLHIDMTAQQAADTLGNNGPMYVEMDFCSSYSLGVHNESYVGGLAESQGAGGPLDSLSTYASWGTVSLDARELPKYRPRTEAGISTGSTMSELKSAYSGKLEISRHVYIEGGHYADLRGPGETMIRFNLDEEDIVYAITTGRVPQAAYIEGCA